MADQSSKNAYQASIVTRDRMLASKQEAIDVLKRMIAEMQDDPNMVKLQENLTKILEHPEVITDEVFANIMSKTNEVLDSNYETQVQDLIDTAKSRGISGPALQVQLQRAKEARATAMTGALRDAIIQRSQEGLSTQISAVQTAANTLTQLLQNKASMTQQLVNEINQIVEEPFANEGPAALPQAAGGGGGGKPITMDFSGVRQFGQPTAEEAAAAQAEQARVAANQADIDQRNQQARALDAQLNAQLASQGRQPAVGTPGAPAAPSSANPVVQPITPESIKTGPTETRTFGPGEKVDLSKAPDTEVPLDVYLKRLKGRDLFQTIGGVANMAGSFLDKVPQGVNGITDTFKGIQGALNQFSQIGNGVKNLFAGNNSTTGEKSADGSGLNMATGWGIQPDGTYSTPYGNYTMKNGVADYGDGYAGTYSGQGYNTLYGPGTQEAGLEYGKRGPAEGARAIDLIKKFGGERVMGTSEGAGVYQEAPKANPYGSTAAAQEAYAAKKAAKQGTSAPSTGSTAPATKAASGATIDIPGYGTWYGVDPSTAAVPVRAGIDQHIVGYTFINTKTGAKVGATGDNSMAQYAKPAATPAAAKPTTPTSSVSKTLGNIATSGGIGLGASGASKAQQLLNKFFGGK